MTAAEVGATNTVLSRGFNLVIHDRSTGAELLNPDCSKFHSVASVSGRVLLCADEVLLRFSAG